MHIVFILVCFVVAASLALRGLVALFFERRGIDSLKYFGAALSSIVGGVVIVAGGISLLWAASDIVFFFEDPSGFSDGQLSIGEAVWALFLLVIAFAGTVMAPIIGARFGFRIIARILTHMRRGKTDSPSRSV